jgi:c-di-GMP-binding flagellar brake protein YcgR
MENRRRHFRQLFNAPHSLRVTLTTNHDATTVSGTMVNLSIGGICVETSDAKISTEERWIATFTLDLDCVTIPVERVYAQLEVRARFGFRFMLPTNLNIREAQEKTIWKFMLERQRSERRQKQEATRAAG